MRLCGGRGRGPRAHGQGCQVAELSGVWSWSHVSQPSPPSQSQEQTMWHDSALSLCETMRSMRPSHDADNVLVKTQFYGGLERSNSHAPRNKFEHESLEVMVSGGQCIDTRFLFWYPSPSKYEQDCNFHLLLPLSIMSENRTGSTEYNFINVSVKIFKSINFSGSSGQFSFTVQDLNIQFVIHRIKLNWTVKAELLQGVSKRITF